MQKFLRRLDTNDATLFEVFGLTETFVDNMKKFESPCFDKFLSDLNTDEYGNIVYDSGDNSIVLNCSHHPTRRSMDRLGEIRKEGESLKNQVVDNLIANAVDMNQSSTVVEFASLFDLNRKLDKETQIEHLKKLHLIYGKEYVHTIPDDDGVKGDLYEFTLKIRYSPKLTCSESDLVAEMNSLWPTITKSWLKYKDSKPESSRIRRFWTDIISEHAIDYPNLCDMVMLLLAISPGTGPVERSFSKLAKICYKDRGNMNPSTMEILYLLSSMSIKEDDEDFLKKVREGLQKE